MRNWRTKILALVIALCMMLPAWGIAEAADTATETPAETTEATVETAADPETAEETESTGWDTTGEYVDGLAVVSKDGAFGYINEAGEVVIPAVWDSATDFSDGTATVGIGLKAATIDTAGIVQGWTDVDEATLVLATYLDGQQITVGDVSEEYTSMLDYYQQMYSYYGYTMTDEDYASMKQYLLQDSVQTRVLTAKAAELGFDQLTDEEAAQAEASATETYNYYLAYYGEVDSVDELDDAARQKAIDTIAGYGYDYDRFLSEATATIVSDKLRNELVKDVTVDETEIQTAYEADVAASQSRYESDTATFESDMTSGTDAYWYPEGYRTVKHILLVPEDETVLTHMTDIESQIADVQAQIDAQGSAAAAEATEAVEAAADATATPEPTEAPTLEELSAQMTELEGELTEAKAAVLESVSDKIAEVTAAITAGESFDSLIEKYTGDTGSLSEPVKTTGYYVSANSTTWDAPFQEAAMGLTAIGDVAEPVVGEYGVYIIRYESDVTPGTVALEDVHDDVAAGALSDKQSTAYEEAVAKIMDEANVTYYLSRWA